MREAKAHFEEATLATPPSQSGTSSSGDAPPTDRQASPTPDAASPSGSLQNTNGTEQASTRTAANGSSEIQQPSASNSKPPSTIPSNDTHAPQSSPASASSAASCSPQSALAAAHKATKQPGSSTALVLHLREGSNTLTASNLVRAVLAQNCNLIFCRQCVTCPPLLAKWLNTIKCCWYALPSVSAFPTVLQACSQQGSMCFAQPVLHPVLRPHQLRALPS